MGRTRSKDSRAAGDARAAPATTSIAAAVFFALYGAPRAALADQSDATIGNGVATPCRRSS